MTRWLLLLFLPIALFMGIQNESTKIEQKLHGDVVLALADEGMSEVRVQVDGREVQLSGPETMLEEAYAVADTVSGVKLPDELLTKRSKRNFSHGLAQQEHSVGIPLEESGDGDSLFVQVIHPDVTRWPDTGVIGEYFSPEVSRPLAASHIVKGDLIESFMQQRRIEDGLNPLIDNVSIREEEQEKESSFDSVARVLNRDHHVIDGSVIEAYKKQNNQRQFILVEHPEDVFWPVKKESLSTIPQYENSIVDGDVITEYLSQNQYIPTVQVEHPSSLYWPIKNTGKTPVRPGKEISQPMIVRGEAINAYLAQHKFIPTIQVIHPQEIFLPLRKSGETPIRFDQNKVSHMIVTGETIQNYQARQKRKLIVQVEHPKDLYWPLKNAYVETRTEITQQELLINKVKQRIGVNGVVPTIHIQDVLRAKLEQYVSVAEDFFAIAIDKNENIPDWYSGNLPLLIPFFQWVEEGQLSYKNKKIIVNGIVQNKRAIETFEVAVANVGNQFSVENRLRVASD
ncbi:MAG: hypothetical protein AB8D52_04805 [Gammaproteobacteria bacterium]